jgi:hypothetical protein
MAKIVTSALVADIRKKIGGNVFTKGRHGAFVRRKVSPIQPRSAPQRNVRAGFTYLSKLWSTAPMTDALRAAWNALAANYPAKDKFGQSHILTGLQLFQKLNRVLQTLAVPLITTPPATLSAGYPGALTVVATAPGTLTINPATHEAATENAIVMAGAQVAPGRAFIGKKYVVIGTFGPGGGWPFDCSAAYVARFGALISTKKVPLLVKYASILTGATGTPSAALATVS